MTNTNSFLASLPPDSIDPAQAQLIESIHILGQLHFVTSLALFALVALLISLSASLIVTRLIYGKKPQEQL